MSDQTHQQTFGLIVVGDEILSGRRQDKHFPKIVEMMSARGLQLSWVEIHGDDRQQLTEALKRSFASGDIVICCGGIGATPDDHTRQAAAAALGVDLALHPEAREQITLRVQEMAAKGQGTTDMDAPENQHRLQMGCFPVGSEIVPNPYNRIPGFFIRNHTFVPGFPVMAWPMVEWTLDHRYAHLHHVVKHEERSLLVYGLPESRITPSMEALEKRWQGIKAFSLPSVGESGGRPHIELGVKGDPEQIEQALAFLREEAQRAGGHFS